MKSSPYSIIAHQIAKCFISCSACRCFYQIPNFATAQIRPLAITGRADGHISTSVIPVQDNGHCCIYGRSNRCCYWNICITIRTCWPDIYWITRSERAAKCSHSNRAPVGGNAKYIACAFRAGSFPVNIDMAGIIIVALSTPPLRPSCTSRRCPGGFTNFIVSYCNQNIAIDCSRRLVYRQISSGGISSG